MKRVKKKPQKVYTFTKSELDKFVYSVSRKNLSVYLAASVEEWGITEEQIREWLNRLGRYMDAVNSNLISLQTIENLIAEELGADIFKEIY